MIFEGYSKIRLLEKIGEVRVGGRGLGGLVTRLGLGGWLVFARIKAWQSQSMI